MQRRGEKKQGKLHRASLPTGRGNRTRPKKGDVMERYCDYEGGKGGDIADASQLGEEGKPLC